jgi:hypothetical protein
VVFGGLVVGGPPVGIFGTPVVRVCDGAVVEVVDDVVLVELVEVVAPDVGVVDGVGVGVVIGVVGAVVVTGTVVVVGRVVVVVEVVVVVSAPAGERGTREEMTRPNATAAADTTNATERGDGGKFLIRGGPEASGSSALPSPAAGEASTGPLDSSFTLLRI